MNTTKHLAIALLVFCVSFLGWLFIYQPVAVKAQNTACFRTVGGALWACGNGGEMEFRSGSTLDVQSGATFSADELTISDLLSVADATVEGDLALTPQTVITITQSATLTPTGALQQISSAGNVSFGAIAAGTAGDLLILNNVGSNTITISDTTGLVLSGNAALGPNDSIILGRIGSNWVQLAPESDN